MSHRLLLPLAASVAMSCVGSITERLPPTAGGPGQPPGGDPKANGGDTTTAPEAPVAPPATLTEAAPARMRRLTAAEIKRSIRDVFLGGAPFDPAFPPERITHSFDNLYGSLSVSDLFADALQAAAEQAAALATRNLSALHPCDPASKGEAACAADFVEIFGLRTFRRPLDAGQKQRLLNVFTEARKTVDYKGAIATVIEALLQAPPFLFRSEYPTVVAGKRIAALGPYETASALSYFIWGSAPDPMLLEAAKASKLSTRAEIAMHAGRLLQDPRAKDTFRRFFREWLGLRDAEELQKTDRAFTPQLAESMNNEVLAFVDNTLWTGDASLETLFRSTWASVGADVARLYGLANVTGPQTVMLDAQTRGGLLTRPGFIAAHTPPAGGNPIFMGAFIRQKLLCQGLPPPPPGVPPAPDNQMLSTRQRYAQHRNDPQCNGCHVLIDPIGFAFERYDVLGRHRTMEGSAPLTGEGELVQTDVDGRFFGPLELSAKLLMSPRARECFVGQLMEFMLGREVGQEDKRLGIDRSTLAAQMTGSFKSQDIRELITGLVTSEAFLFRDTAGQPAGGTQ